MYRSSIVGVISWATSSAVDASAASSASGRSGPPCALDDEVERRRDLVLATDDRSTAVPEHQEERDADPDEHDGHDEQRQRQAALLASAAAPGWGSRRGAGAGGQNA